MLKMCVLRVENAIWNIYVSVDALSWGPNTKGVHSGLYTHCFGDNEAFMVRDWAMKFLLRKYREGKTDYLLCQKRHQLSHQCGFIWRVNLTQKYLNVSIYFRALLTTFISNCTYSGWYYCKYPWYFQNLLLDRQYRML